MLRTEQLRSFSDTLSAINQELVQDSMNVNAITDASNKFAENSIKVKSFAANQFVTNLETIDHLVLSYRKLIFTVMKVQVKDITKPDPGFLKKTISFISTWEWPRITSLDVRQYENKKAFLNTLEKEEAFLSNIAAQKRQANSQTLSIAPVKKNMAQMPEKVLHVLRASPVKRTSADIQIKNLEPMSVLEIIGKLADFFLEIVPNSNRALMEISQKFKHSTNIDHCCHKINEANSYLELNVIEPLKEVYSRLSDLKNLKNEDKKIVSLILSQIKYFREGSQLFIELLDQDLTSLTNIQKHDKSDKTVMNCIFYNPLIKGVYKVYKKDKKPSNYLTNYLEANKELVQIMVNIENKLQSLGYTDRNS